MALELLQLYAPTYGQTPDQGNGRTPRSLSKHKRVTFLNEIIQNSLTLARNDLRADFRQDSPPLFVTLLALDSFHQRLISRALSLPFASISCFPLFSPIFFTFHFLFHSRSIHRTLCRSFNTTFICGKKSRWTRLDADNSTLLEKKVPGFSSSTADCTLHFFFFFFFFLTKYRFNFQSWSKIREHSLRRMLRYSKTIGGKGEPSFDNARLFARCFVAGRRQVQLLQFPVKRAAWFH